MSHLIKYPIPFHLHNELYIEWRKTSPKKDESFELYFKRIYGIKWFSDRHSDPFIMVTPEQLVEFKLKWP